MPANRSASGQFVPGASGNPAGRPRDTESLRARAREMSVRLLEELNAIALDEDEPTSSRIEAIQLVLAYGHGRPHVHVDAALTIAQLRPIAIVSPTGADLKVIDVEPDDEN
jgi:hypothetical protein